MAGWGGPGWGLNWVLPRPPVCGLERGSFPCPRSQGPHPQGPWCSLSQWGRGLGSAPLTPLWSCRPLPSTQDSPGASPTTPCTRALPRGAQDRIGGRAGRSFCRWGTRSELNSRQAWSVSLTLGPPATAPVCSFPEILPSLSLNLPSPTQAPVWSLTPLSWLVLAHLLFSANFCAHSPLLTEKKSTA